MAPSSLKLKQLFSDAVRPAHLQHSRNPIEPIEELLREARAQPESAPALFSFLLVTLPDCFLLVEATDVFVNVIDERGHQLLSLSSQTGITNPRRWEIPALHSARQHS